MTTKCDYWACPRPLTGHWGSGTTGVACQKLGKDFIGIEINPDYFKIAEKRINETTKQVML
jgi:DNA modification methylase